MERSSRLCHRGCSSGWFLGGRTIVVVSTNGDRRKSRQERTLQRESSERTDTGGSTNFLADALGSTVALTDSTGTVQTNYSYEPFGKTTVSGAATSNNSAYTGRELDATGLYFYRARYYNPQFGRFTSEDPIGFAGGINVYSFVSNSPTNWIDPLGLRPGDKYPTLRCAGWHAIRDINSTSRQRTPAFPNGREYGGWTYENTDGTYSYTAPVSRWTKRCRPS